MQDQIKNLPIFKKILLLSFLVCLILVVSAACISLYVQEKLMEEQLEFRVVEMASLWGSAINTEEIERVKETKDPNHPSYQKLADSISLVNENAPYNNAILLFTEVSAHNEIDILASSNSYKKIGLEPFTEYKAEKEFLTGFNQAIAKKKVATSGLYQSKFGPQINAFVPIMGPDKEVISVLSVSIDAAVIDQYQNQLLVYLASIFLIIMIAVFFIFKRGLKKALEPINEIVLGFNEVSNGNFDVKLNSANQTDLGVLFDRFNNMTKQLSMLFERLSATSEEFRQANGKAAPMLRIEDAIDEMEQILNRSKIQRELQRAEKMNAIGQLAASVAHEIRNPMTVVKGFLQIFLAKDQMSEEERMYIRLMIEEMSRAETIINDYLSLAKPDMEQTEKVNAGELVSKVLDLMNSYAMMSKNVLLVSNLQDDVFIKGNASELKQVIINIYKNGIEAMKNGGTLTLNVYKDDQNGVFEISDTGIGMTDEQLERLGTAFYSLKEKGTGIGMMVCYQIVSRMKGRIEVKSRPGEGTTFKIFIPLIEDENQ